jgi:hypothetical protein
VDGGGAGARGLCWAALVARVLHPAEVQIIEALRWIERPLSAGDLSELFDGKLSWVVACRHIRHLTQLGAIETEQEPALREFADIRYRLTSP